MQCKHVWNICDTNVITFRISFISLTHSCFRKSIFLFHPKFTLNHSPFTYRWNENSICNSVTKKAVCLLSDLGFVIIFFFFFFFFDFLFFFFIIIMSFYQVIFHQMLFWEMILHIFFVITGNMLKMKIDECTWIENLIFRCQSRDGI